MKVLHLNTTEYLASGGTGIAMTRLSSGLRTAGIDSRILTKLSELDSPYTSVLAKSKTNGMLENGIEKITWRLGLNNLHVLNSSTIQNDYFFVNANLLNLHCIHSQFLNYLALPELTKYKPAVFTLHDMWAFTGHCTYSFDCDRWKTGCGRCPYPDVPQPIGRDNTHIEWKLKKWVYGRSNLTVVTPSLWLTDLAKQSLLNELPIHHIPHGIDTNVYQPLDRDQCRAVFGVPADKKVLLFGAQSLKDKRKGSDLLFQALENLPQSLKAEIVLMVFGEGGQRIEEIVGIQTLNLGVITSDRLKVAAYSAADLFLFPTRADNMPLVLLESIACGTPVVSFKVGGVPDTVRPGLTGYLATPEDAEDFKNGIVQLLEDASARRSMQQECREIALREYNLELYVKRYVNLYQQVLNCNSSW